jgi:NAD(P)-dependent dehydrogenase (short-subunit alcohol dehydrogenase family)
MQVDNSLQDKTALVTGASRGLGRAIAERLAAAGALVAVNYVSNLEAAQEVVSGIEARGGQAFLLQQDMEKPDAVASLVERLEAELVRRKGEPALDILINNVGGGEYARILDTSEEFYDATFTRNTRVAFFLVKALYHRFRSGGSVVNISSEGVRLALPEVIAYNMAKAALDNFTRSLVNELGPLGVRVNSVMPGMMDTHGNQWIFQDPALTKQVVENTALRRIGSAEDFAEVVHSIVSPAWSFVTGQWIEVSGGYRYNG